MTASDRAAARQLLDKQAITETLFRYARGWDRRDLAGILECFHPDSSHRHGASSGPSHEVIRQWFEMTTAVKSMTHLITNILIDLTGDAAICESHFLAHHRRPAAGAFGERDWFIGGRYLDRFERREDVWKIAARTGLEDFERLVDAAEESHANSPAEYRGRAKPDDPLYALLAGLA